MRILISSDHRYPADDRNGMGRRPRAIPSGSGYHIFDLTVRGLAELGHDHGLLLEAAPLGVARPQEDLDRDVPAESGVRGAVDHTAGAPRDLGRQLVGADSHYPRPARAGSPARARRRRTWGKRSRSSSGSCRA